MTQILWKLSTVVFLWGIWCQIFTHSRSFEYVILLLYMWICLSFTYIPNVTWLHFYHKKAFEKCVRWWLGGEEAASCFWCSRQRWLLDTNSDQWIKDSQFFLSFYSYRPLSNELKSAATYPDSISQKCFSFVVDYYSTDHKNL